MPLPPDTLRAPQLRRVGGSVLQSKQAFIAVGAKCHDCPLKNHKFVRSEYGEQTTPDLAIVSEAPGKREVLLGRPFVGASGNLLEHALKQTGIRRNELAIINAVSCGPIPHTNESWKVAAAAACRPRLLAELKALQPKAILAVGAKALSALAPPKTSGVTAVRGALLSVASDVRTEVWNPPLFSTFHPAHIMRGGDGDSEGPNEDNNTSVDMLYHFFEADLAKARGFGRGDFEAWKDAGALFVTAGPDLYRVITSKEGRPEIGPLATEEELKKELVQVIEASNGFELSCDVETDGKDSLDANLTAIGYATPDGGISATWEAWQKFPLVFDIIRQLHADRSRRWLWQNGIYDRVVLRRHLLAILGSSEDTLLKHHAAFPGLPHRLDQVAAQFFITTPWKNEFRTSVRDEASLVLYNYRDAHATARISVVLNAYIKSTKTNRVYEADRQLNVIATDMREVGQYVDADEQARHRAIQTARLDYMRAELAKDFKAIEEDWRGALAKLLADKQRKGDPDGYQERVAIRYRSIASRRISPTDIGLFKPKAKADIVALFNVLGIPFSEFTAKGAPVTDKKAMETAAARHPLMRRLIHIREAQHLIATYINLPVKSDGRFHPDWKTNKITGRWGAGKSQNVPNNVAGWPPEVGDDGKYKTNANGALITPRENIRSIIAAPEGRILVGADMDQVELRILAFLSKDPFLLAIFNEGRDPHSEFSHHIFPDHFPKLIEQIKAAGYTPKGSDKVEDEITKWENQSDELAGARLKALRQILKAQKQWKRLRDFTKRVEYGGAYRGQPKTIWTALVKDMPEVELTNVEHGIKIFYEKACEVPKWHNEQEIKARVYRESREALLGRVRMFPLGNFSPTIVVNFPIQAYGASLMAKGMFRFVAMTKPHLLELDRLYKNGLLDAMWVRKQKSDNTDKWTGSVDLISQVHDSILVECNENEADRVVKLLTESMTQEVVDANGVRMVFSAEAKKSKRWSRT